MCVGVITKHDCGHESTIFEARCDKNPEPPVGQSVYSQGFSQYNGVFIRLGSNGNPPCEDYWSFPRQNVDANEPWLCIYCTARKFVEMLEHTREQAEIYGDLSNEITFENHIAERMELNVLLEPSEPTAAENPTLCITSFGGGSGTIRGDQTQQTEIDGDSEHEGSDHDDTNEEKTPILPGVSLSLHREPRNYVLRGHASSQTRNQSKSPNVYYEMEDGERKRGSYLDENPYLPNGESDMDWIHGDEMV